MARRSCCRATSRHVRVCSGSRARSPPAGRYQWALIVDAPGLADRHELGTVTVFADQAAAVADAEQHAEEDPTAITYLKEPQWTNGFATVQAHGSRGAAGDPSAGGDRAADRRRGRRRGTGRRPLHVRHAARRRHARQRGPGARAASAAIGRRRHRPRDAGGRRVRGGGRRSRPLAPSWRAPSGCWPSAPSPAVASRRRSAPSKVAEARLTAAQARLAQRDEALRTGGGAAERQLVRAACADRRRRRRGLRGARRLLRRGGAAVPRSCGPIASSCRRTSRPPTRRSARTSTKSPSRFPAGRIRWWSRPTTCITPGIIDPRTRALPVQFDVDNRGRPAAHRPDADGDSLHRPPRADADRPEGRRADGGRPPVCVRADRRRELLAALHRDCRRATAIWSAFAAASSRANAS